MHASDVARKGSALLIKQTTQYVADLIWIAVDSIVCFYIHQGVTRATSACNDSSNCRQKAPKEVEHKCLCLPLSTQLAIKESEKRNTVITDWKPETSIYPDS